MLQCGPQNRPSVHRAACMASKGQLCGHSGPCADAAISRPSPKHRQRGYFALAELLVDPVIHGRGSPSNGELTFAAIRIDPSNADFADLGFSACANAAFLRI